MANVEYSNRLEAIRLLIESSMSSDQELGLGLLWKRLQDAPNDRNAYDIVLSAAQKKPLLVKRLIEKLSILADQDVDIAQQALDKISLLSADKTEAISYLERLLHQADNEYYSQKLSAARKLYQRVLFLDPRNTYAQNQIAKTYINPQLSSDIPHQAIQYYRKARSYIAARDMKLALAMLNAAIEEASEHGKEFPEAHDLLAMHEQLARSLDYIDQARNYIKSKDWSEALESYQNASRLDPGNLVLKDLVEKYIDLLDINNKIKLGTLNTETPKNVVDRLDAIAKHITLAQSSLYTGIVETLKTPLPKSFRFEINPAASFLIELGGILIALALAFNWGIFKETVLPIGLTLTAGSILVVLASFWRSWKEYSSSASKGSLVRFLLAPNDATRVQKEISANNSMNRFNWGRLLRIILSVFLILGGLVVAFYILPRRSPAQPMTVNLSEDLNVQIDYTTPEYAILNDTNVVEYTIYNMSDDTVSDLTTTLTFPVTVRIVPPVNGNTSDNIEYLNPGSRVTRELKFILKEGPSHGDIDFGFQISTNGQSREISSPYSLKVAPIPYLSQVVVFLTGTLGLTALIQALIKKLLGFK